MFTIDTYLPTKIVFGYGRLNELKDLQLPGKKALICVTADGLMSKLGIQQRVEALLKENGMVRNMLFLIRFVRIRPKAM